MLPRWIQVVLALLAEAWSARRDAQLQFLRLQIHLLRQKLSGNRVILSPEDRQRLLRAGQAMDHAVDDVLDIVSVKTYRRWIREQSAEETPGRVGRLARREVPGVPRSQRFWHKPRLPDLPVLLMAGTPSRCWARNQIGGVDCAASRPP